MVLTPDLPRDRIGDEKVMQASEALTKMIKRVPAAGEAGLSAVRSRSRHGGTLGSR